MNNPLRYTPRVSELIIPHTGKLILKELEEYLTDIYTTRARTTYRVGWELKQVSDNRVKVINNDIYRWELDGHLQEEIKKKFFKYII